jgi:hypothetical protein
MTQNGDSFAWSAAKIGEAARGKLTGNNIEASWNGNWGSGSASGSVEIDADGRAVRIRWSNGVVFTR